MTEAEQIALYVAEHGVTRCPVAYLWSTQAAADRRGTIGPAAARTGERPLSMSNRGGASHRIVAQVRRARAEMAAYEVEHA